VFNRARDSNGYRPRAQRLQAYEWIARPGAQIQFTVGSYEFAVEFRQFLNSINSGSDNNLQPHPAPARGEIRTGHRFYDALRHAPTASPIKYILPTPFTYIFPKFAALGSLHPLNAFFTSPKDQIQWLLI